MFSRITYAFRETWASFQRNLTLTAAAILTAAVALLLVGVTFLIQEGFSNLLAKWTGGVEMIVYVQPEYSNDQARIDALQQQLASNATVKKVTVLNQQESYEQAKRVLTGQDSLIKNLPVERMPAQLRVVPVDGTADQLPLLKQQYANDPTVWKVALATDDIKVVAKISNFVRRFTIGASVVLLIVAVVLIWNTIRTAMFARRREIEVMKLVGATNWFIRVPFMLEGLLQGLIGSLLSCGGLALVNGLWNNSLGSFGSKDLLTSDLVALQVSGPFLRGVMIIILIIGALVGAVAAGIAASRFLDV